MRFNELIEGEPIKHINRNSIQCAHNFGIPEYYHGPCVAFIWNTPGSITWLRKVTATYIPN